MVRKTRVEYQCDLCSRADASTWLIQTPDGDRARVDLCPKHAEPLTRAFRAGRRHVAGAQGVDRLDQLAVEDY